MEASPAAVVNHYMHRYRLYTVISSKTKHPVAILVLGTFLLQIYGNQTKYFLAHIVGLTGTKFNYNLKSVRVELAYGRIAIVARTTG